MGVLNVTPDSFYAGSRASTLDEAMTKAETMIAEGADLLDIGGESTRPGSSPVSLDTELQRVIPLVKAIHQKWPDIPLSIDTQKAEVARQALAHGASVINDISALRQDPEMAGVIVDQAAQVVLMHMQGTPPTMQRNPHYARLMEELIAFFEERLQAATRAGIREGNIVIDPGIGFGKTLEHNMTILKNLAQLQKLGRPILVGVSRKSFIGKLMDSPQPEERLQGSITAGLWAVQQGANGLRVHDVGATRQALTLWQALAS